MCMPKAPKPTVTAPPPPPPPPEQSATAVVTPDQTPTAASEGTSNSAKRRGTKALRIDLQAAGGGSGLNVAN